MLQNDDPHAIYNRVFEAVLLASGASDSYCLVSLPVSHEPMGRYRRFAHLVFALRNALTWCLRHRFTHKRFIIREFSTWALVLMLPLAYSCRQFVGFNINHNLVGKSSRVMLSVMARFLDFFYFSGQDKFSEAPDFVHMLNVSNAYTHAHVRSIGVPRHAVVVLPRRSDHHQPKGLDRLVKDLSDMSLQATFVGRQGEERLSHDAYTALLSSCTDMVLAYHQGSTSVRHSGVIWDAILHGVPRIYVPDTVSFRNQVGGEMAERVYFYSTRNELLFAIQRMHT